MGLRFTNNIDLLTGATPSESSSGVTTTTTGETIDVSLREQIIIQFQCANHTSGNGVFSVDGSNDGTNWVTGLAVQDLTATASATYITSVTLNANGSHAVKVPAGWRFIRADVTVTTDGTYFAKMEAAG
jgi:hypothetical protein